MRSNRFERWAWVPAGIERVSLTLLMILALGLASGAQSVAQAVGITGTQSAPHAPRTAIGQPGPSSDTVISPDDVVDVSILDVPELSGQYRVSKAGTVQLPLLQQPLRAAGLMVSDFAGVVAGQLRENGLVSNAQVTVSIASSRLQSVAITGAVKTPQIYPVFGRTTLLDLLAQAQGLSDDASNIAVIIRGEEGTESTPGKPLTQTVELTNLLQYGDPASNPYLYPGDRVTVPRAGIVYVVGAVNKPGGYPIKQSGEGMTVLQALAFAEDTKPTAKREKAVVIRPDPTAPGGRRQQPLNLKKILAAKETDPKLEANDILFIPDSPGKKAIGKGLDASLSAATILAYRF